MLTVTLRIILSEVSFLHTILLLPGVCRHRAFFDFPNPGFSRKIGYDEPIRVTRSCVKKTSWLKP